MTEIRIAGAVTALRAIARDLEAARNSDDRTEVSQRSAEQLRAIAELLEHGPEPDA